MAVKTGMNVYIFMTLRHHQVFLVRKKASTPPAASPTRLLSYIP
jgi:hypothetical protein